MARSRRTRFRFQTELRGYIRRMIRAGTSPSVLSNMALQEFPRQTLAVINREINLERARYQQVQDVMRQPTGKPVNWQSLIGCPPGTSHLRVSVRATFTDKTTGQAKTFSHILEVPAQGTRIQFTQAAVGLLLEQARFYYDAPRGEHSIRQIARNAEFMWFDCV